VDNEIIALYKERMGYTTEVAEYKIANNKAVFDKQREDEKLAHLSTFAKDDFERQGIVELFELIMSTSRKKPYRLLAEQNRQNYYDFKLKENFDFNNCRVVFQGVEGAYSQVAMETFFGESQDAFSVDTWRDAMEALTKGKADYAVLPIENSTAGAVTQNYDLLAEYDVCIVGEQEIPIDHCLLGMEGARLSDITKVYSHPQAIMQCDGYLRAHCDITAEAYQNTAMAAKKVHDDKDIHHAAIAGKRNAKLYNLSVIEEGIQDLKNNVTRFIIVSNQKEFLPTADKISLTFEIPDEEGSLYHILSHFIFNGLNMSKIESRPLKDKQWEYRFFIDFKGNLKDEAVQNTLRGLQEETSHLKVLGNYS
ncbi:MAG: prephenate dehydratase, partial [Lachnospiraceae bacterium]|nr:prephenate dehydratase [Lachnospiraceae bacterium]